MSKIQSTKPLLIIMYGFPGSGKTHFARQLSEKLHAVQISSDRVRNELFEEPRYDKEENEVIAHLMHYMTEEFLSAGVSVIYDSNVARLNERRILRDIARKARAVSLLLWFQIDAETAFARIAGRDRRRTDDKYARPFDRATYEAYVRGMQNPKADEDYMVLSGKHSYGMQQSTVMKKLYDLGVIEGGTASANVVKPGLINLVPAGRVDMTRRNINIR